MDPDEIPTLNRHTAELLRLGRRVAEIEDPHASGHHGTTCPACGERILWPLGTQAPAACPACGIPLAG